jgi:metal-responsive CopG/Arc/MetJ family transcriptional regulator
MKKNTNMTLDIEIIKRIDEDIKSSVFASRSHALNKMAKQYYLRQDSKENKISDW